MDRLEHSDCRQWGARIERGYRLDRRAPARSAAPRATGGRRDSDRARSAPRGPRVEMATPNRSSVASVPKRTLPAAGRIWLEHRDCGHCGGTIGHGSPCPLCDFRLEHRDWGRSGARIRPRFGRARRLLRTNTLANACGRDPVGPQGGHSSHATVRVLHRQPPPKRGQPDKTCVLREALDRKQGGRGETSSSRARGGERAGPDRRSVRRVMAEPRGDERRRGQRHRWRRLSGPGGRDEARSRHLPERPLQREPVGVLDRGEAWHRDADR